MNISAVLSNMGKHKEIFKLAKKANSMFLFMKEAQLSQNQVTTDLPNSIIDQGQHQNLVSSFSVNLVISYYNMGISSQSLGNKQAAYDYVNQGYHFALIDLGQDHGLTQNMKNYLIKLESEIKVHGTVNMEKKKRTSHDHDVSRITQGISQGHSSANDTSKLS